MKNLKAKMKKQGGFTLIEMLIVVAIIAVLVMVSIPMVNSSLEKANEATDNANVRAALGAAMAQVLSEDKLGPTAIGDDASYSAAYEIKNGKGSFVGSGTAGSDGFNYGKQSANKGGFITVTYTTANKEFTYTWTTPTP